MFSDTEMTTARVLAVFTEAIAAHGGQVADTFDDGLRLFARSVLPRTKEVRSGDRVQGGVALKATREEVELHPFVFRLICRNGAIIAQTLEARRLVDIHLQEPDDAVRSICEGVEAVCEDQVFTANVRRMRTACEVRADMMVNLMPILSRLSMRGNVKLLTDVMELFFREGDSSRFGLANAVTAVARDTKDPQVRWDLEEFGGGLAVGTGPKQPAGGGRAAMTRPGGLALVS